MIQITSYAQSAKLIFPSFLRVSPTFSRSSKVETSIVRSNAQGIVGDFVKVTTNSPKSTSNPLRVLEIFENLTPPPFKNTSEVQVLVEGLFEFHCISLIKNLIYLYRLSRRLGPRRLLCIQKFLA